MFFLFYFFSSSVHNISINLFDFEPMEKYIFSARYLSLKERKRICAFLWKNEPRRTSALHMIWWHSANRDVLPGSFQPYACNITMYICVCYYLSSICVYLCIIFYASFCNISMYCVFHYLYFICVYLCIIFVHLCVILLYISVCVIICICVYLCIIFVHICLILLCVSVCLLVLEVYWKPVYGLAIGIPIKETSHKEDFFRRSKCWSIIFCSAPKKRV